MNPKEFSSFETEIFGSHRLSFDRKFLKSSPSKASWIGFGMERGHQFQFWAMSLGSDLLPLNSKRCDFNQFFFLKKNPCDLKLFAIKTNQLSAWVNFQNHSANVAGVIYEWANPHGLFVLFHLVETMHKVDTHVVTIPSCDSTVDTMRHRRCIVD